MHRSALLGACSIFAIGAVGSTQEATPGDDSAGARKLRALNDELTPQFIELTDGVFVAAGYAEICDHLIAYDAELIDARLLKANALDMLGRETDNALARNYYLTVARELRADALQD